MAESNKDTKEKKQVYDSSEDSARQANVQYVEHTSIDLLDKESEKQTVSNLEKEINKLSLGPTTLTATSDQSIESPKQQTRQDIPHDSKCPICHDKRIHSITLPNCGHSFCYLCIKGVYARQKVCPLCRQSIPANSINRPLPLNQQEEEESDEIKKKDINKGTVYNWYYQAKSGNGWWLYEERISLELERCYQASNTTLVNVQISGFMYTVDFERMIQYRQEKPDRVRCIKRMVAPDDDRTVAIDNDGQRVVVIGVGGIPYTSDDN